MRAFIKENPAPRGGRITDLAVPAVASREVLIRVEAVGLCGTDLSIYAWWPSIAEAYKPALPLVMGHEFGGTVTQTGRAVNKWAPGDRVGVVPLETCGHCRFCRHRLRNLCLNRRVIGIHTNGGLAEFAVVPEENLVRLPKDSPSELLALWEPFAAAQHALTRTPVGGSDSVAIVGPGGIGLMIAIGALARGVRQCFVVGLERDLERLKSAQALGCIEVNADRTDQVKTIRDATHGRGVDVAFEAAGSPAAVDTCLRVAKPRGRVCIVGTPHDPTPISTSYIGSGEIAILGSRAHSDRGISLATEQITEVWAKLPLLQIEKFSLEDTEAALDAALSTSKFKVMVYPDEGSKRPGAI